MMMLIDVMRTSFDTGRRRSLLAAAVWSALVPMSASAHGGAPPVPHDAWQAWNLDPVILLGLGLAGWVYGRGIGELWRRAGTGRGVRRWQAACTWLGLAALVVALVSPLDRLGEALFSFHMVQHLLLTLVAAPLFVLGGALPWLWALPASWRRPAARLSHRPKMRIAISAVTHPTVAVSVHAAVLWAWHAPRLYEAALTSPAIHALEHSSFFATALLFWWSVLRSSPYTGLGYGGGVIAVFVTALQGGALGALLTFSDRPWYPAYGNAAAAWGLTPLEDQQLAGSLMWVLPGVVYLMAALALVAAWIHGMEREGWVLR